MKAKVAVILIPVLILISSASFAFVPQPTPTMSGSTGLIMMPSADVIPYKNVNFGLDLGPNNTLSELSNSGSKWSMLYKMNIGTFQGMELGCVGMEDPAKGQLHDGVYINMKYSIGSDTSPYPLLLALGVENLTSTVQSSVYMVATKYFPNSTKLHFGFIGDFTTNADGHNKFRPLGALGYECPIMNERTYFLTDMFAGDYVFQLDIALRWYWTDSVAINLSGVNVTANKDTMENHPDNFRNPQMVLIGVSLINPL